MTATTITLENVDQMISEVSKSTSRAREIINSRLPETKQDLVHLQNDDNIKQTIMKAHEVISSVLPTGVLSKITHKIPFKPVKKYFISKYVENTLASSDILQEIFKSLSIAQTNVKKEVVKLSHQHTEIKEIIKEINTDIEKLEELKQHVLSQEEHEEYVIGKIDRKIRDLKTITVTLEQFLVSIYQTIEAQSVLDEQIESVMLVGPVLLQNAIRIRTAIIKQEEAAQVTKTIQDGLNKIVTSNAEMIRQNAENIMEMYHNPVVAFEALQLSYEKLKESIKLTRKSLEESNKINSENIRKIDDLFKSVQGLPLN